MWKMVSSAALALMLALPVTAQSNSANDQEDVYEQLDRFMRIFQLMRSQYVDDIDDKEAIEAAIQGMLRSLDPHSTYFNTDAFEQVRIQTEGEYGGLGIEVQMDKGVVKVVSPIDDTPADRAGIQGGDYITHLDGEAILGQTLTDAIKIMRGAVGEPITVTVVREGVEEPFDVEITREKILVRAVRHRIEEDTIGYLRITTFNQQTGKGVEDAVRKIREEAGPALDGLIIDLRNNPGGLLDEAIRVSDAFLDRGEIVSTRGRRRENNNRWYATHGDLMDGLPIVVLVNAYSASASEIVAGALKDHRRAVILGDKTFGKGTVQSEIRLGEKRDYAIRLTTARYFTPSGQSIQERGVEPDIEVLFPRPANARGNPRREADLRGHIENDQNVSDRAGEEEPLAAEEQPEPQAEGVQQAPTAPAPEDRVDVQLKYAIKLLKNMSALPKAQIAEAR
ncbi:S41 family peptidase [Kordiimonas sp. SCSIO 12610]|uniref:S41 family peptidase n=1 Tax=Kordiimonas sp. SCSIO 12610 TaxID=2829597 RepID=UPI002108E0F6|nr:S41 family peptidase [Kordiimonas sp. SCSIO 12610]UTW55823.1 S41 family peptidase [Kordiimonas sp. SCSIO 12610]